MLTPEQIQKMNELTGLNAENSEPVQNSRANEVRKLIEQSRMNRDLGQRTSDIAASAAEEYQKTKTEAELRQEAGQQGAVSTAVQTAGAAAKAGVKTVAAPVGAVVGATFDSIKELISAGRDQQKKMDDKKIAAGTLKPEDALSRQPNFEDVLAEGAASIFEGLKKRREMNKAANPEKKDLIDIYQESSPATKANIKAATDVAEAAVDVASLGVGGKVTKDVAQKTLDVTLSKSSQVKQKIISKAIDKVETKYQELSGTTITGRKNLVKGQKVTEAKNLAGTTGRTPERVLAEDGILPKAEGERLVTQEIADKYYQDLEPIFKANKDAIKSVSTKIPNVNLNEQRKAALEMANSPKNINSGEAKGMTAEINSAYDDLIEAYGENVPVDILDDIKSARFGTVKFDATKPFKSDSNYTIAKVAQKTIQDAAEKGGFKDVAQLNREVGDRLEAIKFLRNLDGRPVKGGRLTRLAVSMAASTAGASIPAKIAYAVGGDFVAKTLINNSVAGPVKRLILSNLAKKDPVAYKETVAWLEKQGIMKDLQLALPPRSGPNVIQPKNGKIIVAEPGFKGDITSKEGVIPPGKTN